MGRPRQGEAILRKATEQSGIPHGPARHAEWNARSKGTCRLLPGQDLDRLHHRGRAVRSVTASGSWRGGTRATAFRTAVDSVTTVQAGRYLGSAIGRDVSDPHCDRSGGFLHLGHVAPRAWGTHDPGKTAAGILTAVSHRDLLCASGIASIHESGRSERVSQC
jgi:hypothetical protein